MNPDTDPRVHSAEELAFIAVSKLLAANAAARAKRIAKRKQRRRAVP